MIQLVDLDLAVSSPSADPTHVFHAVHLDGYCSVKGSNDVACAMTGLAFDSGIVLSSVEASFADEIILSLPQLGLQKGVIARVFEGGFEVHFSQAAYPKVWAYLAWLADEAAGPSRDSRDQHSRDHERIVPIKKIVGLQRHGEPHTMVRIVDLSRSGVAFTTSKVLTVGEPVMVGCHSGRISRLVEGGAAVRFDALIPADRFDVMIDLAAN